MAALLLAACMPQAASDDEEPTITLLPILSHTPRLTATPEASRTPIPTFTFTPSLTPVPPTETATLTPSPTPPITGIVQSLQAVNVREGPGVTFRAIAALVPGTGVMVLGATPDEDWLNIRMDDGSEGWISARLLFIRDTPTPIPTATPSPDLTALFLGTPLPTAIIGGGTVTPTPPGAVRSPTPVDEQAAQPLPAGTELPFIPVIDLDAINMTATALVLGIFTPTPDTVAGFSTPLPGTTTTPGSGGPLPITPPPASGSATVQTAARVFALCDDLTLGGGGPPTTLAAGSTIVVWWGWLASTAAHIEEHLSAATYEVRVNGELLANVSRYRSSILRPTNDYAVYWYVPYDRALQSGTVQITYRVTWSRRITDGYQDFGPGTNNLVEEGSCTFTVR